MSYGMNAAQERVSNIKSLMSPLGGINDIDALASMPPQFCIQLDDFYPGNSSLSIRKGYKKWATDLDGKVRTIMSMALMDGTFKTFACTDGGGVYDVTIAVESPALLRALGNGIVSYTQFANSAGQFLICCNGDDPAFLYNGTTFITFQVVADPNVDPAPGKVSGISSATVLLDVIAHKKRLWFIEKDSLTAYYLETDAVGGVLTPFYLGGVFHYGGYLVSLDTWSLDAGNGLDDKLVFRSSNGEIAIYAGNDPNLASDWALESLFYISPPVGQARGSVDLGGDLVILTETGAVPISKIVQGAANVALYDSALSKNINRTLGSFVESPYFENNWEIISLPSLQALMIVIPETNGTQAVQYIMNIITGAWARYLLPANCFGLNGRTILFGGTNTVYVHEGYLDNVNWDGTGGDEIEASLFSAFNYFDDSTTIKHWKLIRPIFQSASPVKSLTKLAIDYDLTALEGDPYSPAPAGSYSIWNEAIWGQDYWQTVNPVTKYWRGVTGVGFCSALMLRIKAKVEVRFSACEFVFEKGDAI